LQDIRNDLADLKISTSITLDNTAVIKDHLQDEAAVQRKRKILEWICPTDYHEQHADYAGRREDETGEWFLQDPKFQEWKQSAESTLFCPGMPGAGKTTMAALVIDRLLYPENESERPVGPVAFIYCKYEHEQSTEHILATLLRQVVDTQRELPQVVQDFYAACVAKRTLRSKIRVEQILIAISKDLPGLAIVVDALDECEAETREDLLSIVEALRNQCKVRLLATSRDLPEIKSHAMFLDKPTLEVRASDQDLEKKVRSRLGRFPKRSWHASKPVLDMVVSGIVNAAGGM
jgi:hypothetical protein